MKILVMQHFEDYWNEGLSMYNTDWEKYSSEVMDFVVKNNDIDKIIITRFEDFGPNDGHRKFLELCERLQINVEFHQYAYAWERHEEGMYPEETRNIEWCQGTRDHHQENDVIEITEWMHELKNEGHEVLLAGAFERECLLDIETAFKAIEIDFKKITELSVGSFVEYEFNYPTIEEIELSISSLEDLNNRFEDFQDEMDFDNLTEEDLEELEEFETECNELKGMITAAKLFKLDVEVDNSDFDEMLDKLKNNEDLTKYSDLLNELRLNQIKTKLNTKNENISESKPTLKKLKM